MSSTCTKDFNISVAGVPPGLPPFLYADNDFTDYFGLPKWNVTLTLVGGTHYVAANISGNPFENVQLVRTNFGADWEMTVNSNAHGPFVTIQYDKSGTSPVGMYTYQPTVPIPFPYPPPPLFVTLATTSLIQITTSSPLPDAASMTAYSQFIVAYAMVSTPAFSIVGGALPSGLNLNGATGEISGSATAVGVFNFTVRATDSAGFADKPFQLTVNDGLQITTATPMPKGLLSDPYSRFLTASNNSGAVTWAVHAGALPNGLNLVAGTGEISGTPTVAAVFGFTIRATDSLGFVDKVFSLEILAALPAQVQVTGTLTVPPGFACLFGGGVTLDPGTQNIPINVTLNNTSAIHYDDGTGAFTMDLVGGLWAITSIGGIYNGFPLGVAPFAPFPVNLTASVNCASASQGLFDVEDNPGVANLLGFHAIPHLSSYTDVSLPTALQTDNYASGTLDVQAI